LRKYIATGETLTKKTLSNILFSEDRNAWAICYTNGRDYGQSIPTSMKDAFGICGVICKRSERGRYIEPICPFSGCNTGTAPVPLAAGSYHQRATVTRFARAINK